MLEEGQQAEQGDEQLHERAAGGAHEPAEEGEDDVSGLVEDEVDEVEEGRVEGLVRGVEGDVVEAQPEEDEEGRRPSVHVQRVDARVDVREVGAPQGLVLPRVVVVVVLEEVEVRRTVLVHRRVSGSSRVNDPRVVDVERRGNRIK